MIALRNKPRHYSQQFEVSGKPEFKPWTSFADGGLTRTVAPDSGPMSQGIMGTRTGFKYGSKKKTPWYLWPYKRAQEWDKIIKKIKERLVSSDNNGSN